MSGNIKRINALLVPGSRWRYYSNEFEIELVKRFRQSQTYAGKARMITIWRVRYGDGREREWPEAHIKKYYRPVESV